MGTRREGPLLALKSVLEIIVIAFFVTTFIAQPFQIPSSSMVPTLRVGDLILVDKQTFAPGAGRYGVLPKSSVQRGDLIVFHWPVDPTLHLVKRVVGVPGDRIRLHHGRVFRNGQPLAEPYAFYSRARPNGFRDEFPSLREADPNMEPAWWMQLRRTIQPVKEPGARGLASETWDTAPTGPAEITVPPNQYFVLGDNRNDSEDSRYWGFVPRESIVGRPLVVYFAVHRDPPPTGGLFARLRSALRYGFASMRVLR
jgi:signal peptidase I